MAAFSQKLKILHRLGVLVLEVEEREGEGEIENRKVRGK